MSGAPLPLNRIYLSHTLSEPAFGESPDTLYYVRMADGKRSIVRQSLVTGLAEPLTTDPMPAGRVGYGCAIFAVREEILVYSAHDCRLHAMDLKSGNQWAVTPQYEGVAAPALSPCGRFVAFLCEQDKRCNVLLAEVQGKSLPIKLSDDPWFAFNPTFSPDGARIAWQEWDAEHMPWDHARLVSARFAAQTADCRQIYDLLPLSSTVIAKNRVSYASPQFSPSGKHLAFTSDESGWRSLWVSSADGSRSSRVETGEGEIGNPDWVPGLVSVRWSADGKSICAVRRHRSADTLLRIDWPTKKVTQIRAESTEIASLCVGSSRLAYIGATPHSPAALFTLELKSSKSTNRATSGIGLVNPRELSDPQVISWTTGSTLPCWGVFYPAREANNPSPLIVTIHGGPTSERSLTWDAQAQYFATRGWHYLVVNHRGSSGFGRAYQDSLLGNWGVLDVEDARAGAEHLVRTGMADPRRLVITGGSAGGYTTLMALTRDPEFWAAGVSLYGIGNMYDLMIGSHRFEVNYEKLLIADLPEGGPLWKERSPLTHVRNVRAPVLLFHGIDDRAVPHRQSVEFAEAVRRNGGIAELVSFEGEGHGFVQESTRREVIEKMETFLEKYVRCLQR